MPVEGRLEDQDLNRSLLPSLRRQRIQTAILAGTTAKAALQPLIDDYFPPLPLPDYFLASECFKLGPARRREIEATVQRTRKTCQAFRKRAAVVANAYTGPPEGFVGHDS